MDFKEKENFANIFEKKIEFHCSNHFKREKKKERKNRKTIKKETINLSQYAKGWLKILIS